MKRYLIFDTFGIAEHWGISFFFNKRSWVKKMSKWMKCNIIQPYSLHKLYLVSEQKCCTGIKSALLTCYSEPNLVPVALLGLERWNQAHPWSRRKVKPKYHNLPFQGCICWVFYPPGRKRRVAALGLRRIREPLLHFHMPCVKWFLTYLSTGGLQKSA